MQCKNCGQNIREGASFCTSCGYRIISDVGIESNKGLDNSSEKTYKTQNNSKGKTSRVVAVILVVLLIVIATAGIVTNWAAPLRAKYNITRGNKYIQEEKFEEAIPVFQRAIQIDEKNIDSRLKLAELYLDINQNDKAKDLLEETLKLDKTNQSIYIMFAEIYEKEKNNRELIKLLSDGLKLSKEKSKLQKKFDTLLAEINISDINASVELNEKYTLPKQAQFQIGEDKIELPIDWKVKSVDTSKGANERLEGTIKYINKPIILNLSIEIKPAVITEKKTTKNEAAYSVEFSVPAVTMEGKYSENAALLNSIIEKDTIKYVTENIKFAEDALKAGYIGPEDYAKYQFNVSYKAAYNKNGLISIVVTYYSYTGGAHGMAYKTAYNFDLIQGKELGLQDVFNKDVNPIDVIKEEVISQMNADMTPYFPGSTEDVRNYDKPFDFYISEKGIVVWFGEYEISPYSSGMPEFIITRDISIN